MSPSPPSLFFFFFFLRKKIFAWAITIVYLEVEAFFLLKPLWEVLDQKSIFLPPGKRKREKEKRGADGERKMRGKILLGSGAWLHLKAYELLHNRPGRSLPFSTLFSKLQPSACEALSCLWGFAYAVSSMWQVLSTWLTPACPWGLSHFLRKDFAGPSPRLK